MKTPTLVCSILSLMLAAGARPQSGGGEELAVWRAMAETIVRDNASHPYRQLYFKTDFGSVAVDLSGGRGGIMRLDKVSGAWTFTTRCAAWIKPRTS